MITRNDILLLLSELEDKGINVDNYKTSLFSSKEIPIETIKFINDNRSLDIIKFYEKLRYNYNHKKSDLYINIMKEINNLEEVLVTLSAYSLQVLLFSKKLEDDKKEMFYSNAREEEVTRVLNNYFNTFDIEPCITLISLIKADIKLFEEIKKKENNNIEKNLN